MVTRMRLPAKVQIHTIYDWYPAHFFLKLGLWILARFFTQPGPNLSAKSTIKRLQSSVTKITGIHVLYSVGIQLENC